MVRCYTRANRLWKTAISFSHQICYGCGGGWERPLFCCFWHEELFSDWSLSEVRFSPRKADTVISWHFSCPPPLNTAGSSSSRHIFVDISYALCQGGFANLFKFLSLATWLLCLNLGDEGHSFNWPKSPHRHQGLWLSFHTCIAFAYWRCKNIPQVQKEVCAFPISLKYNSQFIFCYLTL